MMIGAIPEIHPLDDRKKGRSSRAESGKRKEKKCKDSRDEYAAVEDLSLWLFRSLTTCCDNPEVGHWTGSWFLRF
jgi:hypothetical protein